MQVLAQLPIVRSCDGKLFVKHSINFFFQYFSVPLIQHSQQTFNADSFNRMDHLISNFDVGSVSLSSEENDVRHYCHILKHLP